MKKFIHKCLIKMLLSDGGIEEKYINQETKRIDLGLYSIQNMFFEPHHRLACILLEKWYKYTFWEERITFNSTWCDSGDKVNENFKIFNQRIHEERSKVIKRNIHDKENKDVVE